LDLCTVFSLPSSLYFPPFLYANFSFPSRTPNILLLASSSVTSSISFPFSPPILQDSASLFGSLRFHPRPLFSFFSFSCPFSPPQRTETGSLLSPCPPPGAQQVVFLLLNLKLYNPNSSVPSRLPKCPRADFPFVSCTLSSRWLEPPPFIYGPCQHNFPCLRSSPGSSLL